MELQETKDKLAAEGYGLAAISYDTVPILASFAKRKNITYALLSDEKSATIRAFNILNETIPKDNPFFGVPHPVTYVVDRRGVIKSRHFEDDFRERETLASILVKEFNFKTGAAETVTTTKHLTLTASSSNQVIRGGEHITLRLDIALNPNMHVYAPGVEGYIPIDWKMDNSPAYDGLAVQFPKSKILYLKAIDEKVPVYEGQFTLARELKIAPVAKLTSLLDANRNLTVNALFTYQACDDHMCYIPQKVPVKWTLHFEPHDVQRAPDAIQHKLGP